MRRQSLPLLRVCAVVLTVEDVQGVKSSGVRGEKPPWLSLP
jgi:hypothetical protein